MDHEYRPVETADVDHEFRLEGTPKTVSRRMFNFILVLLGLLVGSNGLWLRHWVASQPGIPSHSHSTYYSPNDMQSLRPLHWNTDFSSDNRTISNKLWKDLFPYGEGVVTVSAAFVIENDLPQSLPDPEIPGNSMYLTSHFHNLHCIAVMRASFYHYREGLDQTVTWMHITHCLDEIRQALMCHLDSTLLASNGSGTWGDGQLRVCRDWEGLFDWVGDHGYVEVET